MRVYAAAAARCGEKLVEIILKYKVLFKRRGDLML